MKKEFVLYEGFDSFIHTFVGVIKRKFISNKELRNCGLLSYNYCLNLDKLSSEEFKDLLITTSHDIRRKKADKIKCVAIIAQSVKRVLNITPYIEQLMGVHSLINGQIIQMYTGEGKTLTAAMGAIYKAWETANCHVVTSNDYLAQRDATKMQELFSLCNLDVGFVISKIDPNNRKEIYNKKIVYSTSKELLADYLRDKNNSIFEKFPTQKLLEKISELEDKKVMRGLSSVIIDEADSVLADEAIVPLIIASKEDEPFFHEALEMIFLLSKNLNENVHYIVNKKHKEINLTKEGKKYLNENIFKIPKLWQSQIRAEYLLRQILMAKYFYLKNINYVIENDEIVIIDEKTGRLMYGRSWGGALHQAIEIKEGVTLTQMTKTHKKMSFQFFFRLYKNISGMSGTLHNIHGEIWSIYEILTVFIPPHAKKQVEFFDEVICLNEIEKWDKVSIEAIDEAKKGRAVLIGTRSIEESQLLYNLINPIYFNTTLLNANFQEEEALIISKAGEAFKITIATNMAGRGTDIILDKEALANGGLHVISTQRHESKRVDMQLYGRTGRQGQVGSVRSIISLDDYIFDNYSSKHLINFLKKILKTKIGNKVLKYFIPYLQFKAEKSISNLRKKSFLNDLKSIKKLSFSKEL